MSKVDLKTFGSAEEPQDPLALYKKEAIDRMKVALLSTPLDDPKSVENAIKSITILRMSHQVARIIQYLDLMDKLESKLYTSINLDIQNSDEYDKSTIVKLISVQERLQKLIVDSQKSLDPYLDLAKYEAFSSVEAPSEESPKVLNISSTQRHLLRESAGAILEDLEKLESTPESA